MRRRREGLGDACTRFAFEQESHRRRRAARARRPRARCRRPCGMPAPGAREGARAVAKPKTKRRTGSFTAFSRKGQRLDCGRRRCRRSASPAGVRASPLAWRSSPTRRRVAIGGRHDSKLVHAVLLARKRFSNAAPVSRRDFRMSSASQFGVASLEDRKPGRMDAPIAINSSIRRMLTALQKLPSLRGVKRIVQVSSPPRRNPSIQPKQSASSRLA